MKYVYFRGLSSQLSSDETLKIIEDWSQTASVPSLNSIILQNADFSSDETCVELADFINDAAAVYSFNIQNQSTTRPISIEVVPASGSVAGSITISDKNTGDVIVTRATTRTESLYAPN